MKLTILDGHDARAITEADLPLSLGGASADLPVAGHAEGEAVAWIDATTRDDGTTSVFVKPADDGSPVTCNGAPLVRTTWLHAGDTLRAGGTLVRVEVSDGAVRLVRERGEPAAAGSEPAAAGSEPAAAGSEPAAAPVEAPPEVTAPAGASDTGDVGTVGDEPIIIRPIEFTPAASRSVRRRSRWPRPRTLVAGAVLLALALAAAFLVLARVVEIQVEPTPDAVAVGGGLVGWKVDARRLLLPGTYRVRATAAGHAPLDAELLVGPAREQVHRFEMEPLPGRLALELEPAVTARVGVDDGEPAPFDGEPLELPAGDHAILVLADGHLPHRTNAYVRGRGETQELLVRLVPDAAELRLDSDPPGAFVRVDGESMGRTPVAVGLASGSHEVVVSLPGRVTERRAVEIRPGRPVDLGVVALARAPGRLVVTSTPPGAGVSVDGARRGTTPVELDVPSDRDHDVRLSLAGHRPESLAVRLGPGEQRSLNVALEPLRGVVQFDVAPATAELLVDGAVVGPVPATLTLPAVPHALELRAPGRVPWTGGVTPDPARTSLISVTLKTEAQVQAERTPPVAAAAAAPGLRMVLVEPGGFDMGASRREPGRRANEKLRPVAITRPFYLAETEVTNAQFREFDPGHGSGAISGFPLDGARQPVVRVTWQQAARFCNWLSLRESLPLAYREVGGDMVAVRPPNAGYRLPTEAEWEWAARSAKSAGETVALRRYSWGDGLPPPPKFANLAGQSAARIVPRTLPGYDDGQVVTAEVGSFSADRRGLHDMTGNVAEWVHDPYEIPASVTGGALQDPLGPEDGELHVIKGSSWMHATVTELRLAFRDYGAEGRPDAGFRVARTAR